MQSLQSYVIHMIIGYDVLLNIRQRGIESPLSNIGAKLCEEAIQQPSLIVLSMSGLLVGLLLRIILQLSYRDALWRQQGHSMTQFLRTHSRAFRFIHEIAGHRYSTHFNLKALTEIFVYIFLNYKTNKVKLPSELSRFVSVQLSLTSSSFALKVNKSETIFHFCTTIIKSCLDFYLVVLSRRFLSMILL